MFNDPLISPSQRDHYKKTIARRASVSHKVHSIAIRASASQIFKLLRNSLPLSSSPGHRGPRSTVRLLACIAIKPAASILVKTVEYNFVRLANTATIMRARQGPFRHFRGIISRSTLAEHPIVTHLLDH